MQAQKMGSLYKLYCWGWRNSSLRCFSLSQHLLLSIFLYYRQGFAAGTEWKRSQIEDSEWRQNQMDC